MKEIMTFISDWGGIILLLIIAVIGIIGSLAGSSSSEERQLSGQDAEHFVLRQPLGRVAKPLILLAVGVAAQFVLNFIERFMPKDYAWTGIVAKLVLAVIFGFLFWSGLANVIRRRVFVNGDRLVVTPAFGRSIETNYAQIRTVANKRAGGGGVVGKKIRTKEGNRFEVLNSMSGYDQFCKQLDAKVELPNLARRIFKGKDKKAAAHEETWEKETGAKPPVLAGTAEAPAMPQEVPSLEAQEMYQAPQMPDSPEIPNAPAESITQEMPDTAEAPLPSEAVPSETAGVIREELPQTFEKEE